MENENSLHCKVSFRNELRRFPMNGVGFTELQKIIQTLFAIEKEFSLQYRDNENDLVILSSNEELACAISCISGNILQIMVIDPTSPPSMDLDQKSTPPFYPPWGCHFHPHPHHFPPHHSPHHFHRQCHFGKDQSERRNHRIGLKKEMLSRKLKEIDTAIMEMSGQEETLPPLQQRKLFFLQKKKRSIENRLAKMEEWTNHILGKKSEKCNKKHAKHEKKIHEKN